MGVPPPATETLAPRVNLLRESLRRSQSASDEMVAILGTFDSRLTALDTAMRPTLVRTHVMNRAHMNIDKALKSADAILARYDIFRQAESTIVRGPHEDLGSFIAAIDLMRSNVDFFASNKGFKNSEVMLNHFNSLLAKAISKLDEEFSLVLASFSDPVEPQHLFDCLPKSLQPSSESPLNNSDSNGAVSEVDDKMENSYGTLTLIQPGVLLLLRELAQQLVQSRHQMQCLKIYRENRASALEQSLQNLGVVKLSTTDLQNMPWEILEPKIRDWINFIRIAVKLLFAAERKICDQIFEGIDPLREQCFAEATSNSVQILLGFGEAVTKFSITPEKLFALLDMYDIMKELQPEIETIFESKTCSNIRKSAASLMKQLARTIVETFHIFEERVESDPAKHVPMDGRVHPLTSYVINYLKFLFDYQSTLKEIFQGYDTEGNSNSQLETVTMRLIHALQINMDAKSKQFRDPALTHLFLMNNIHYIVLSVRGSEAKVLLGDDWIQRHRRTVQQNANQYRRTAWSKILQTLSVQGLGSSGSTSAGGGDGGNSSGASRDAVKERFKSFNQQFEELHQRQSQWIVPDPELAESLRLTVAELLLPAYRSFVRRFGPMIENSRNSERYKKYSAEDLDRMLGEFFQGRK